MKEIKFLRLDRQYINIRDQIIDSVDKVMSSGQVLQGEMVDQIEERVSSFHNQKYGVAVGSGTDALIISLKSLGIKAGDRVGVTSLSFIASVSPILNIGAIPEFVDIDDDLHGSEETLTNLIKEKEIKCVLLVHLFGEYKSYNKLKKIA